MLHKILNRFSGELIIEIEAPSIKIAVGLAVKQEADLQEADLQEADLQEADLRGADLRGADLRGADLQEANLRGTNLRGAGLRGTNLWGARGILTLGPSITGRTWVVARHEDGVRILAGCKYFTLAEARKHWGRDWSNEYDHTKRSILAERNAYLDLIEVVEKRWMKKGQ